MTSLISLPSVHGTRLRGSPSVFTRSLLDWRFFMPLELSFSCWFFYLYWQALRVLGSMGGLSAPFPYAAEQSFGAYLGIGIVAVWSARRYLSQVIRRLFGTRSTLADQDEPISYRAAVVWMLLSIVFLIGFCYKLGMSLWVIATFFGLFFGLATGITRMRAELGSPVHDQHYAGPDRMMYSVFGAKRLGASNLTGLAYLYFFNRAYDCLLMPHHLEGLKIAERADIENKTFAKAVIVAIGVSIVATIWAYLHVSYQDGVYTAWAGRETFSRLGRRLVQPAGPRHRSAQCSQYRDGCCDSLGFSTGAVDVDAVPSSGLCRHQHLHDEFLLVFAVREFYSEMDYYETQRHRRFSEGGTLFPRSRVR